MSFAFSRFAVAELDTAAPGRTHDLQATVSPASTSLAWTAPADADVAGYRVYRSTTAGPVPATAANLVSGATLVTSPSWVDNDVFVGQTWNYSVYAVDASGNVSAAGASTSGVTPVPAGSMVAKIDFTTAAGPAVVRVRRRTQARHTPMSRVPAGSPPTTAHPSTSRINTRVRPADQRRHRPATALAHPHCSTGLSGNHPESAEPDHR